MPSPSGFNQNRRLGLKVHAFTWAWTLLVAAPGFSATVTWDAGGATGDWSTASNWNPDTALGSTDSLLLDTSGITTLNNNTTANNIYGLAFNSGSSAFTIGGNAITLDATHGIANNGTSLQTLNTPFVLGATATVNANTGGVTLGGAVSGSGNLTKTGTGTLTLTGANTYSGTTLVSAGLLDITAGSLNGSVSLLTRDGGSLSIANSTVTQGSSASGNFTVGYTSGTGTVNVGSGGVLNIGTGGARTFVGGGESGGPFGNGILNLTSGSAVNIAAAGAFPNDKVYIAGYGGAGTINLNGGTLTTSREIVNGSGSGSVFNFNGGTLRPSLNGMVLMSSPTVANVRNGGAILDTNGLDASISKDLTHSAIGGDNATDGGLTKNGAGILTLSGANTYNGGVNLNAGGITAGNAAALGTGAITLNAGTLRSNGFSLANNINSPASTTSSIVTTASETLSGALSGTGTVNFSSPTLSQTIPILPTNLSGFTGTIGIDTSPAGNSYFPAVNTANGGQVKWVVTGGGTGTANGSGSFMFSSLAGSTTVALGELSGNGRVGSSNGTTTWQIGALNTSSAFTGIIFNNYFSGTAALQKVGTGTLTLSGPNAYTGATTISAGTLAIGNGGSVGSLAGSSAVSIASGATAKWDNNNDTTNYVLANNFSGAGTLRLQGYNDVGGGLQNAVYELSGNSSGFTGSLELNRALAWNTTSPNNVGSALIVVGDRATMSFNGNIFANNITVNQDAGWHHNAGGDVVLGAIRLEGNNTLSGNITLNNTASIINGDNTGKNSTIGGYTTGNHSLTGVISGAGDLAMSRLTSWNGGSVQAVNITLGGSASNTYTGKTVVDGQGAVASLILAKTGGAVAIPANTIVQLGSVTGGQANLRMGGNNQFGSGVELNFVNVSGQWMRFDLLDTNQTLAGMNTGNLTTQGSGVTQNGGVNATSAATSTLTLDGSGTYVYNGHLRNRDNVGTGILALSKTGTGTQTLVGNVVNYTGATSITGGTLALQDTTIFNSAINVGPSGTLNVNRTALGYANRSAIMANAVTGSGIINVNNAGSGEAGGWTIINGGTGSMNFTGTINVNSGVFTRDSTNANNIGGSATVNVAAGAVFGAGRGGNSTIGALNGSGTVSSLWAGSGNAGSITMGNGGGSGSFSGVIRGNGTNATDGTLEGGVMSVIKTGTGTQILSGVNTYSGLTWVQGGTLEIATGGSINNAAQLYARGTTGGAAGTLSITGGSVVSSTSNVFGLNIGDVAGQPGAFNISAGTFTLSNAGGGIVMGQGGTGTTATFTQSGGVVTIGEGLYLSNGGGGATSTVNISGGTFNTGGTVRVGQATGSTGVFTMTGGTFNETGGTNFWIGENGTGTMNVSGTSVLNLATEMWVGYGNAGTLNLSGGTLNHTGVHLVIGGNSAASKGTYNQTGGTYNFSGANGIYIGNASGSVGTMTINGGTFSKIAGTGANNRVRVGNNTGGVGTLNVGGTANVVLNSEIWIGGDTGNATGTLNLSGGSMDQSGQYFVVGNSANPGVYNQTGGSYTFSGVNGSYLGNGTSGSGTMNVSGGTFNQTQNLLRLGQNGTAQGFLNIGGGAGTATVSVPTITFGSNSATSQGTLNLEANGILRVTTVNKNTGSGTFNFNGGTYRPAATGTLGALTTSNVRNGGALFDIGSGITTTVTLPLLHSALGGDNATDGGLTASLTGGGVLYLDGANTYTGPTTVSGGNGYLVVRNSTALGTSAGGVTVASGNTLQVEHATGITITSENATITGAGGGVRAEPWQTGRATTPGPAP